MHINKQIYDFPQCYKAETRIEMIKKHLDEGLSYWEVGCLFGVGSEAIKYHMIRHGYHKFQREKLPRESVWQKKCKTKAMDFYILGRREEGMTFEEIGNLIGLSSVRVNERYKRAVTRNEQRKNYKVSKKILGRTKIQAGYDVFQEFKKHYDEVMAECLVSGY